MKTKIINYIIGLLFIIYYYVSITTSYTLIIVKKGGWCFGDWIINYQDGGFKRRGLFGTLFMGINELTHIKLEYIVFTFVAALYTAIFYLLFKLFWKEKNNLLVIALLLLPVGFGMIIKDPNIATRKEMLFFFLYLLYLLSLRSKVIIKDITITFFIIIALLTHEAAYFYLPFVGLAYFMKNEGSSFDKFKKIIFYQFVPATLIMILLYKFGISLRTENTIPFFKAHGLVMEEMGIFDYDPHYDVLGYYKSHLYDYQTYAISILLGVLTVYIYCKFNKVKINTLFLIIQILFLIPLFYLAVDWGRWVNIFFTLLTIFLATEQRAVLSRKQDIIAVVLIVFNLSWKMMLMTQGFLTFPKLDGFLKQVYYFLYFRISNLL
ncbi:Uncharacterised protein [Chryseobacterium nakagawai]|uniref:Uncharacterized protein n=1 Tax=Chryseobacterium nakagawai TaxID=1241982 RepID=A0AAD0YQ56_CHRNA|nr:hypothetical protein [Chryseobacterium nakagawai]AZA91988.1 hypothetical protein EG343_15840 [Chryseobacterium nakagawai]VEH18512.1 Uncharacterised protein [Chryseobacterium nakagawai]